MIVVTVIGAEGFVGSAFAADLTRRPDVKLRLATRASHHRWVGQASDVVIDCAGSSRKYVAEEDPERDFDSSVAHRLRTLRDFPAERHLHVSSVDVYSDLTSPETTREHSPIDIRRCSNYGAHKLLAELLVRHYARQWLIVRLAGMVGPGLKKNPIYDVLRRRPLRIHPDSRYQFLHTSDVARMVWELVERGAAQEVYNVCGTGTITPREAARMAGRDLNLFALPPDATPRVVDVSTAKLESVLAVPSTAESVVGYIAGWLAAGSA